jgi:hypothetical protein
MLTSEDLRWNHLVFKFLGHANIFPVKFHGTTDRMEEQTSKWRLFHYKLWQWLTLAHTLYFVSRSLYSVLVEGNSNLEHIPIMTIGCVDYIFAQRGYFLAFERELELNLKMHNECFVFRGKNSVHFLIWKSLSSVSLFCELSQFFPLYCFFN